MEDTINNLNQRVEHLVVDLKYQMMTFTKIDNARQKLYEKFRDLQKKNEALELQASQYLSTINELRTKAEGLKPQPAVIELSDRHYQSQTKTKGTYSDKDDSQQRFNLGNKIYLDFLLIINFRRKKVKLMHPKFRETTETRRSK